MRSIDTPPPETEVSPPLEYLEVIKHQVSKTNTVEKPIFHILINGLIDGRLYKFEVSILIPSSFKGSHISTVLWGTYSQEFDSPDLTLRDQWQTVFVTAIYRDDLPNMIPSLVTESEYDTHFYTAGWRLTLVESPENTVQQNTIDNDSYFIPTTNEAGITFNDESRRAMPLGYLYNNGGLNNQKGALAGLLAAAYDAKRPIFLPELYQLDHKNDVRKTVPFESIYDLGQFRDFASKYGVEIVEKPQDFQSDDPHGWIFFNGNPDFNTPATMGIDRTNALVPLIRNSNILVNLQNNVFQNEKISTVLQLRIENDWQEYATHLRTAHGSAEDFIIPYPYIFSKIEKTIKPIPRKIYIVSDEKNLPVPVEEIKSKIYKEFGIELFWKSDFLSADDMSQLGVLNLSLIDFEMAMDAEYFVGLTRSTFSNNVCWEKYCKYRRPVKTHYIYNNSSSFLSLRIDHGVFPDPESAATVPVSFSDYFD